MVISNFGSIDDATWQSAQNNGIEMALSPGSSPVGGNGDQLQAWKWDNTNHLYLKFSGSVSGSVTTNNSDPAVVTFTDGGGSVYWRMEVSGRGNTDVDGTSRRKWIFVKSSVDDPVPTERYT